MKEQFATPTDVTTALEAYYAKIDKDMFLDCLTYLYNATGAYAYLDTKERYCNEKFLCPECYKSLSLIHHKEYIGDMQGVPVHKDITQTICDNCNWNSDKN